MLNPYLHRFTLYCFAVTFCIQSCFSQNPKNIKVLETSVFLEGEISGKELITNAEVVILKDLKIGKNDTLIFGEGVKVKVNSKVRIFNKGVLQIMGTENHPVELLNNKNGKNWKGIFSNGYLEINYANFSGVTGEYVIRQVDGNVKLENTLFQYNKSREVLGFKNCSAVINNNVLQNNKGEGMLLLKCNGIVKQNISFESSDAIEASDCHNLTITENFIINSSDDGIDVNNGTNISVTNNTIINCRDKGISISGNHHDSTLLFKGNYIKNCRRGIGVGGKGVVYLDGNLYSNNKKQLFLENKKALSVISRGEYFKETRTIDSYVTIYNDRPFLVEFNECIKMEIEIGNKNIESIALINEYAFPVGLKGLLIMNDEQVMYKFIRYEIIFPSSEIIVDNKHQVKLRNTFLRNGILVGNQVRLVYKKQSVRGKSKNYWIYISAFVLLMSVIGFLTIKRNK